MLVSLGQIAPLTGQQQAAALEAQLKAINAQLAVAPSTQLRDQAASIQRALNRLYSLSGDAFYGREAMDASLVRATPSQPVGLLTVVGAGAAVLGLGVLGWRLLRAHGTPS